MKYRKKPIVIDAEQFVRDTILGSPKGICFATQDTQIKFRTVVGRFYCRRNSSKLDVCWRSDD